MLPTLPRILFRAHMFVLIIYLPSLLRLGSFFLCFSCLDASVGICLNSCSPLIRKRLLAVPKSVYGFQMHSGRGPDRKPLPYHIYMKYLGSGFLCKF